MQWLTLSRALEEGYAGLGKLFESYLFTVVRNITLQIRLQGIETSFFGTDSRQVSKFCVWVGHVGGLRFHVR